VDERGVSHSLTTAWMSAALSPSSTGGEKTRECHGTFRTFPALPFFSNMCSSAISSVPSGRPGAICSRGVYCVGNLKLR